MTERADVRQPPIVGLGASAGGIEAFRHFFEHMPPDSGLAFVVVLHLPADRKSILPELLGRWTAMEIIEATDGCLVEPDRVYVPPSGVGIVFRDRRLFLQRVASEAPRELSPISVFFDSLAMALEADAIGVVLSGTGSDGALGLKAIKARGGLTLAQGSDGTVPQHIGMPSSAIATGSVDIVASVDELPGHIIAVRQARQRGGGQAVYSPEDAEAARLSICSVLHRVLGHDFSGYKEKTFLRRVQRRMDVLRVRDLADYVGQLEADRGEALKLFRDLLIGVTAFFRDAGAFDALQKIALPLVFNNKTSQDFVRVWVPGCSTGEEAYSIAMLLYEYADRLGESAPQIQVFATDIDEAAIGTARAGRYLSTLIDGVEPVRRARYFDAGHDGSFSVTKAVRALCTFSVHSLTRDPPFSRIDLISCRNLLIYLDADLQAAVIPAFHYSLASDGILLLGSSETISRHDNLFEILDRAHRLFRRRDTATPPVRILSAPGGRREKAVAGPTSPRAFASRAVAPRLNARATTRVLERFSPPFVVVDADGVISQFSSRTGRFLEPQSGLANQSVVDMARRGLRAPLRALLKRAVETSQPAEKNNVSVDVPGEGVQRISLAIEPLHEPSAEAAYLVVFIDATQSTSPAKRNEGHDASQDGHLELELRDTREQLQSVTEEHETALEELRSANEELHSVNEELQSANEEQETAKEEIQSVNEELQTVNAQLANKVDELDRRNSDLQNLFASTQVATIFLDRHLVIRGFTPAVAGLYNLIPSDEGRPLSDIACRLRYGDIRDDIHTVLDTLEPLERRVVRDDDVTHYLMRILPYRAPDSTVDGAVVTFVDVTSIVQAEQHQRLLVDELNHRVKNMLTVVISLATQTMRQSATMEEFSKDFLGRVHALTAAYSLLSDEAWQTVAIEDIVWEELRPFADERTKISVDGPKVLLEPRAALALGMALHELTTNAIKYGALSVPEGCLQVSWRTDLRANERWLTLEWIESGGPKVVDTGRRGFGLTLIQRGLKQDMGADVEVVFASEGVRAALRAPIQTGTTMQSAAPG